MNHRMSPALRGVFERSTKTKNIKENKVKGRNRNAGA